MEIDDFMDITKPLRRINVSTSSTSYALVPQNDEISIKKESHTRDESSHHYSTELNMEFDNEMLSRHRNKRNNSMSISNIDQSHDHESFQKLTNTNPNLAIHTCQSEILRKIYDNTVLIIKGQTGCGKSTQVPQYILDNANKRGVHCNILVTQPRRIAARSLAERVARERKVECGKAEVGYQIGLQKEANDATQILYCTTGVALKKLVKAKNMRQYTHIILDEVHERDEEMEFLLIVVKLFLREDPYNTKIILMSATFNTDEFSQYFKIPIDGVFKLAPTLELEDKREHELDIYYLEDIRLIANEALSEVDYDAEPKISVTMYNVVSKLLDYFDRFDKDRSLPYTVLVFLPGIHEILTMHNILKADKKSSK